MQEKKRVQPVSIVKEGGSTVLYFRVEDSYFTPSLENNGLTMARTMDMLVENPGISRIVFVHRRHYIYNEDQTKLLNEIARLYGYLIKQKQILGLELVSFEGFEGLAQEWKGYLQHLVFNLLRSDPIGAYVELKRLIREEHIFLKKSTHLQETTARTKYLETLEYLKGLLEQLTLIQLVQDKVSGYKSGSRELYGMFFRPLITPDFMFTRLMAEQPLGAEEIDAYSLDQHTEVTIFRSEEDVKPLYHVTPLEFKIPEDHYELLDLARSALAKHRPDREEFLDTDKMRRTFFNIGKGLLQELAEHRNVPLSYSELENLASILVRYTIGFGLIEVLLKDPKIQDISVNGPIGESPIFIVHQDYEDCVTNIIPSQEDGEGWATRFRILSGRPLDEANPVLDTELILPYAHARVSIMNRPLNPDGLAFAFRRHRDQPWTFPLFIKNNMMSPLAAGLLSFLIDGSRTLLFAGTRGSGKTSLLVSAMVEIMRKHRIITLEDTQELPISALRKNKYNIQAMKVRSALTHGGNELAADEGIRTSLRFGDSSLIVGEIRSLEAKALYEAMRIGALANVVAGTIHAADPYSVFDRVVNDLEVPRTSFKATDIIIVSNPVKSADGLHRQRRIIQITEVRKHWQQDPLDEKAFVDLMKYDSKTDELKPTDALVNGESEILKQIAGEVKEWVGNWDAVWENILLRAKIKSALLHYAEKESKAYLLEAPFVVLSNDVFHQLSADSQKKYGSINTQKVFLMWEDWLKKELKRRIL